MQRMRLLLTFTIGFACSAVSVSGILAADKPSDKTVIEMKFDQAKDVPADSPKESKILKMDVSNEINSDSAVLLEQSSFRSGKTGISDKWQPFLNKGYIEIGSSGSGKDDWRKNGLSTYRKNSEQDGSYSRYMEFRGFGTAEKGTGGTVVMVVSPNQDWVKGKHGLFGSGYWFGKGNSSGAINLWLQDGFLRFVVGRGEANTQGGHRVAESDLNSDGDTTDWIYAESIAVIEWKPDKWYFIGASWQEGVKPQLYVRELGDGGPASSAQAADIMFSPKEGNVVELIPAGATEPSYDPIAFGSYFDNPGQRRFIYGADARIAYIRVDKTYMDQKQLEGLFNKLGK